jgi:penicillin-binding protein 2
MFGVVNVRGGTAYKFFHGSGAGPLGIEVCGKTGTATTSPQTIRGAIVRRGDTGWFAGFAPYRSPRLAFAVVLEYIAEGETGGGTTAPIAREVVRICQQRGYLP